MLSRLLLLLCLLALCSRPLRAQTYEPGLLVRANGDTLRGEIENGFWINPPAYIRFRRSSRDTSQLFRPRQLRAVSFTNGRYFRYEGLPIDRAAETRRDRLPQGYHPNVRIDSLLAEVLIEGPASMLRVVTFSTTHYLLRRPDLPVLDLCERIYLSPLPRGGFTMTDGNNYRGQLSVFFGDCPAAEQVAQKAPFTEVALATVVQAYNETCTAGQPSARSWLLRAQPSRPTDLQYGLLAGSRFVLLPNATLSRNWRPYPTQAQPFAGAYAELLLPNRTIGVYGELTLSRFRYQGATEAYRIQMPYVFQGVTFYTDVPVYSTFTSRAWLATAHVGLRYHIPIIREQQLLLGFGLDLSEGFATDYTITSGPPATPTADELNYPGFVPLPSLSIGWCNPRLMVLLDAQVISGLGLRLGLGYRLGRNPDSATPPR